MATKVAQRDSAAGEKNVDSHHLVPKCTHGGGAHAWAPTDGERRSPSAGVSFCLIACVQAHIDHSHVLET